MWLFLLGVAVVIVVASAIHALLASKPRPPGRGLEIVVIHTIFWGIGVTNLVLAYFMGTDSEAVAFAHRLNWPPDNPFQGIAAGRQLALGLGGIGVLWFRGGWIVAMSIAAPLYGWSEVVLWAVKRVPASVISAQALYSIAGGLFLISLVIAYRWRAGSKQFWAHSPSFGSE